MNLADPWWRLENLYSVRQEGTGKPVPFRMRPEQKETIGYLLNEPDVPIYIVKARRLGLSTGIGTLMVDQAAWTGGTTGTVIERNAKEAAKKMQNILKYAFASMPPEILERFALLKDNDKELGMLVKGLPEQQRSLLEAVITSRGGDCSFLWLSESQIIAYRDPRRFEEIRTGAWPAARKGRRVHETSWMGGKGGALWEEIKPMLEQDPEARGRVLFFPWHGDPECVLHDGGAVAGQTEEYFREITEKLGRKFTQEQKRWYAVTAKQQGIFMKREFPSTLEEAFSAPVEGSIYAREIDTARTEARIGPMPVAGTSPVFTSWDLGAPKQTVVIYFQVVGPWIRIVDVDHDREETMTQRVTRMQAKGYAFAKHFFPHDAEQTGRNGKTLLSEVQRSNANPTGLQNCAVVPRTADVWLGIDQVMEMLPMMQFRMPQCERLLEALACYRTRLNDEPGNKDEPVHDWTSHYADALRSLAEAHLAGLWQFKAVPIRTEVYGGKVTRKGLKAVGCD